MEKRIIFHPLLSARFQDFGLSIPIEDDRAIKVVDNLSVKIPLVDMNLITPLTKNDLQNVHSREFVNDFFSSTFQEMIYSTYDLQNYPETKSIQYQEFRHHLLIQGGASFFGLSRMLEDNFTMFLGGGMHHARYESGHGFCPYHDFLSAYFKLGLNAKDLVVVDIDAHQGDGTADIGNRLGVKTISFHMKSGWPLTDPKIKKINSTIDIGISSADEGSIIKQTRECLSTIGNYKYAIVVAGTDAYEKDELPGTESLNFKLETMKNWQLEIYNFFKSNNTKQFWLCAGGYGSESWRPTHAFLEEVL